MGSERIALDRVWIPYTTTGRPAKAIQAGLAKHWSIGSKQPGSQNHGIMTVTAALLERALRPGRVATDTGPIIDHAIRLYEIQRQEGHKAREPIAGYVHFHAGAAASGALAAKLLIDRRFPAALPLLDYCRGWYADFLAILRALRCPDGQVLVIGSRVWKHEAPGEKIWKSAFMALAAQILDRMSPDQVTPWIRTLVPDSLAEPDAKHPDCAFGWHSPGTENDAACLKLLHRAIFAGALPLDLIRSAADGRRPRVDGTVYAWSEGSERHAAATELSGIPGRAWYSRWKDGRCETLFWESLDGRLGSGRHATPRTIPIPAGLAPAFASELPVPELPGGSTAPLPTPDPPPAPTPPRPAPKPAPPSPVDPPQPGTEPRPEPPRGGDVSVQRILDAFLLMRVGKLRGGADAMERIIRGEL